MVLFKCDGEKIDTITKQSTINNKKYCYRDNDIELSFNVRTLPNCIESIEGLLGLATGEKGYFVNVDLSVNDDLIDSICSIEELCEYAEQVEEYYSVEEIKEIISRGEEIVVEETDMVPAAVKTSFETIITSSCVDSDLTVSISEYIQKSIIRKCYGDESITYARIFYIKDQEILNMYLDEKNTYKKSLYHKKISSIALFGIDYEKLCSKDINSLMNYIVNEDGGSADYLNYSEYPLDIKKVSVEVIPDLENNIYLPIEHGKDLYTLRNSPAIYVRGIRVLESSITLSNSISDLGLQGIQINLLGNEYELDVSRTALTGRGYEHLEKNLGRHLFQLMLERNRNDIISEEEARLWEQFIDIYYPKNL